MGFQILTGTLTSLIKTNILKKGFFSQIITMIDLSGSFSLGTCSIPLRHEETTSVEEMLTFYNFDCFIVKRQLI